MITELSVLSSVNLIAGVKVITDFFRQSLLFGLHAGVTHRFVFTGVRLEFTAINSYVTEFHQACPHGQVHTLSEQVRERLPVPGAEPVECPVRWLLVTGEEPECHVFNECSLHFSGASDSDCVSVYPDCNHHPWFQWRPATSLSVVISVNATQVQVVHQFMNEERQVIFWQPVNWCWWQQVRLLRIVITKAFQTGTSNWQEPRSVHVFYHLKPTLDGDSM